MVLGRVRLHPLANRPDLLLLFFRPGIVHGLGVFLPVGSVGERLEHTGHRHAGEETCRFIQSGSILDKGWTGGLARIGGLRQTGGLSQTDVKGARQKQRH